MKRFKGLPPAQCCLVPGMMGLCKTHPSCLHVWRMDSLRQKNVPSGWEARIRNGPVAVN